MGEVAVPLAQWFAGGGEGNSVLWDPTRGDEAALAFPLVSARRRRRVTGRVFLQFGIVLAGASGPDAERRAQEIVRSLQAKGDRHLASLMGVPAVSHPIPPVFFADTRAVPRNRNRQDQTYRETLTSLEGRRRRVQAKDDDRLGGVCIHVPCQRTRQVERHCDDKSAIDDRSRCCARDERQRDGFRGGFG